MTVGRSTADKTSAKHAALRSSDQITHQITKPRRQTKMNSVRLHQSATLQPLVGYNVVVNGSE